MTMATKEDGVEMKAKAFLDRVGGSDGGSRARARSRRRVRQSRYFSDGDGRRSRVRSFRYVDENEIWRDLETVPAVVVQNLEACPLE